MGQRVVARPLRAWGLSAASLTVAFGSWAAVASIVETNDFVALAVAAASAILAGLAVASLVLVADYLRWFRLGEAAWLLARCFGNAAFVLALAALSVFIAGAGVGWQAALSWAVALSPLALYFTLVYVGVGVDNRFPGPVGWMIASRFLEAALLVAAFFFLPVAWLAPVASVWFAVACFGRFGL